LANMNPPDQFAAIPAAVERSALPTQNRGRRPGTTAQGNPDPGRAWRPRGWHGAGQRYG
jgi:hypothetical protein